MSVPGRAAHRGLPPPPHPAGPPQQPAPRRLHRLQAGGEENRDGSVSFDCIILKIHFNFPFFSAKVNMIISRATLVFTTINNLITISRIGFGPLATTIAH